MSTRSENSPQRILIVPLRYIGDTVLTVPLIRNIRYHFPHAELDLLASSVTVPLMTPCPYLNKVVIEPPSMLERFKLLRERRYDEVFLLRKSVSLALLCKLAGVKILTGYDKQRFPFGYKRWGWFLDHQARYPNLKTDTPQAVSHLGLLTARGLTPQDDYLELWSTLEDETRIDQLFAENNLAATRPIACLHTASASHGKQVEAQKFALSLQTLHAQGYQLLATGTAADVQRYENLKHETGLPLINLAGVTSLRETFTLYKRIQLLLTVDSSPIHLGAAAGIPKIVGVFGPTNERQWGPYNQDIDFKPVFLDLPCRPCYAKVCAHNNCRMQLTDSQIAESVAQAICP